MIFTGSITPETSPDMYNKSIYQLMEHYNSSYSLEPLFVNTMGWITGIGAECLQNLIKAVEPTFLINLIQVKRARFDCRQFLNENVKYIEINILKPHENVGGFTAFEMRHLAMLAYLGRCQSPFLRPLYLNEMQPYCVCWDKIAVYVFNRRLPPYRLLEALNGSIVALCNVDESLILESDIPGFQKTLKNEPENDCLGFGVVRAVDETNHLLFIITPLPLKELKNVNAIMKGNILLPQEVLLEQHIDYTAMPFTDHPTAVPTASRKRIQKRVRRQQN
ncbi:polynucleotide 5'-hydroxyl-kinase NOL9-like [Stegodyphus dumicola]|uniref:polynucleotide 5'-hydroxyl-kinase NOL9-like n=1 Tax=Stegodyphus dumicola TaxID=202533 RepID=UPI0015AF7C13|nr:polynucleotide 5'-hydroxyl-kinase NOL9-like [Stegodyphus dumicola]